MSSSKSSLTPVGSGMYTSSGVIEPGRYFAIALVILISFTNWSAFIWLYFRAPCFQALKNGLPTSVASTGIQTLPSKTATSFLSKNNLSTSSGSTPLSNIKNTWPSPGLNTSNHMVSIPILFKRVPYKVARSSQSPILSSNSSHGYFTVSKADLSSEICKNGVEGSTLYTKPNEPRASYSMIALPKLVFPKYFFNTSE